MNRTRLFLILPFLLVACATLVKQEIPAEIPEIAPGILMGYLAPEELPDSLGLLPAPPEVGSPAFAWDLEVSRKSADYRGTARWELARSDADLSFPAAASDFQDALGFTITEDEMPALYRILRRTLTDAGLSTYAAKNTYIRERPFMVNELPTATPEIEPDLRKDGSYPSGHTAIGWAWALILSELVPARSDKILQRGIEFGESRIVANAHWRSDVDAGRLIGAATVARLHADPVFVSDMELAKEEVLGIINM